MSWLLDPFRNSFSNSSLLAATFDTTSIFRRSHDIKRQPGETRTIPGVIGQASSAAAIAKASRAQKRPLEDDATFARKKKRSRVLEIPSLDLQSESPEGRESKRSRKRQRSVSCVGNASKKRLRPEPAHNNDGAVPVLPKDNTHDQIIDSSVYDLLQTGLGHPASVVDIDKSCSSPKQGHMTKTPGLASLHEPAVQAPFSVSGDGADDDVLNEKTLAKSLQERLGTVRKCLSKTSSEVTIQEKIGPGSWKLALPDSEVRGVDAWLSPHHIPGQMQVLGTAPDTIEVPTTKIRKLHKTGPGEVSIRASGKRSAGTVTDVVKLSSLCRKEKTGSIQQKTNSRRLRGIWNRSVGSPMGRLRDE